MLLGSLPSLHARYPKTEIPATQAAIAKAALNAARSSSQTADECPRQIGMTYTKWNQTVATVAAAQPSVSVPIANRRVRRHQHSPNSPTAITGPNAAHIQRMERTC